MSRTRIRMAAVALAATVVAAAALVVVGLLASPARAGTAVRSCSAFECEPALHFSASSGEANVLHTSIDAAGDSRRYWIADEEYRIRLGTATGAFTGNGCRRPEEHEVPADLETYDLPLSHMVTCRWDGDARPSFQLGDRDDRAAVAGRGSVKGGPGNDLIRAAGSLYGEGGEDTLYGDSGGDSLNGGDGLDILDGGLGPDSLHGGPAWDTLRYRAYLWNRINTSTGGPAALHITVADGNANDGDVCDRNRVDGTYCTGGSFGRGDEVFGDVERVIGNDGNDVMIGHDGRNELEGRDGNDRLRGEGGSDILWGGGTQIAGKDRVTFGGTNDLAGGDGNDELYGGIDNDSLAGNDGDDELYGDQDRYNEGRDSLAGGSGNDLLDGGKLALTDGGHPSRDYLVGGPGVDTADYHARDGALVVTLNNTDEDDGEAATGSGEQDHVASDVENVIGGAGNDTLVGNAQENRLEGRGGDDELDGRSGADLFLGGVGTDTVTYNGRTADVSAAIDGLYNDGVTYLVEGEPVSEGDNVSESVEVVIGGSGDDVLLANTSRTTYLYGMLGNDTLYGGNTYDELYGGDGDDSFKAADGVADNVDGGKGEDEAYVDSSDILFGVETVHTS